MIRRQFVMVDEKVQMVLRVFVVRIVLIYFVGRGVRSSSFLSSGYTVDCLLKNPACVAQFERELFKCKLQFLKIMEG